MATPSRRKRWLAVALWLLAVVLLPLSGVAGVFLAAVVLVGVPLAWATRRASSRAVPGVPVTRQQEARLLALVAVVIFVLATVGDTQKSLGGWLWDAGEALAGGVLSVALSRRTQYLKESRWVKVSFAIFVAVLATDLSYTAATGWRVEPKILTGLMVGSCVAALLAMLLAGRSTPAILRRRRY